VVEGALSFKVKTGKVECMGFVVGPETGWVDLTSGDA